MLISITYGVFACDYPKSGSFKTIPLDGAAIVFDFVSTEKESYAIHKPHLPNSGSTVYRGISGEQFHGSRAS